MLRILGSPKNLCHRVSRRDFLWASALGLAGVGPTAAREGKPPAHGFGRAKACILLYLYGAASQLELCDLKPDAPPEVRGEFRPIRSTLPGLDFCEHLPSLARVADRLTVVRSLTHPHPIHGAAYALTGIPQIELPMELNPLDGRHWPFIGSVVDYVNRQGGPARRKAAPDNVALPFPFSSRRKGEVPRAGPYPAFLGSAYAPLWTNFVGATTRTSVKSLAGKDEDIADPYLGVTPESRFEFGAGPLNAEVTLDRLDRRRGLVDQLEASRRDLDATNAGQSCTRNRSLAYDLLTSDALRTALDLAREPARVRESYGMTLFGQGALTARRLVEAGSRFVSVFWDEYGVAGSAWDTHTDHYPRMKNELLPGLDRALGGLVADLDARGMLDDTLVLCVTEHGRTPRLQNVRGGGRDHWSRAYTNIFAGGGVARGTVVGKTDKQGGEVVDRPVSPKDVLATAYHLLGIDRDTLLHDRANRPMPLVGGGSVVAEMLA